MIVKYARKEIDYYEANTSLRDQINKSSAQKKIGKRRLVVKKLLNWLLESLAYNCPVNAWRVKFHKWRGVHIGKNVLIGRRVTIDHSYPEYVYIEDDVSLAGANYILAHSNPYKHFEDRLDSYVAPVVIKKGAWITINVTVLPGVVIGEKAIIGAGVVVYKDVPDGSIVTLRKYRIRPAENK